MLNLLELFTLASEYLEASPARNLAKLHRARRRRLKNIERINKINRLNQELQYEEYARLNESRLPKLATIKKNKRLDFKKKSALNLTLKKRGRKIAKSIVPKPAGFHIVSRLARSNRKKPQGLMNHGGQINKNVVTPSNIVRRDNIMRDLDREINTKKAERKVCRQRTSRREVLHALHKTGRGGSRNRNPVFKLASKVRCK